jgi:thiamine-phosphate pyrophosphorylase
MADRCLLYYITDRTQFPGDEPARRCAVLAKIAEAARANVHYIQLREKDLSTRELEQLAREAAHIIQELRTVNRELRTRLLINSRTDIAIAVGADGVHLRSDDVSPEEVRHVWASCGAGTLASGKPQIAVSCHRLRDVDRAQSESADFAVFAPVFEKKDRPDTQPAGLAVLREACRSKIPVLALGGVNLDNADSCVKAGAAGIAAIRLFQENKIEDIVRAMRAL